MCVGEGNLINESRSIDVYVQLQVFRYAKSSHDAKEGQKNSGQYELALRQVYFGGFLIRA